MQYYDMVFIIVTYRNTDDILDCLQSIYHNCDNCKVIIVNSYYDEDTKEKFKCIAIRNQCDFLNIENRGYGYGNNMGIKFCMEKYEFNFLTVCNPDTIIKKNEFDFAKNCGKSIVVAPLIYSKTGNMQNPYWVLDNRLAEYIIYFGYKHKNKAILLVGVAINKIIRDITNRYFLKNRQKQSKKIYAAHGSFVIFSRKVIELLNPLYDDNMFLFAEEAYIARILKKNDIPVVFTKEICVMHNEDGSIGVEQIDETSEIRKSVVYYYEKFRLLERCHRS